MSVQYVRPGWTGKVPNFHLDQAENEAWAECPSCLGCHHARSKSCNGKREPCDFQCEHSLGEIRCHRPANHIGEHQALSSAMRVEWEVVRQV